MAAGLQIRQFFKKHVQFGGAKFCFAFRDELRMAAGFAEACERAKQGTRSVLLQGRLAEGELCVVEGALFISKFHGDNLFRLRRQFGGDQLLVATDDQRREFAAQCR